jgi:hypothetical protein
MSAKQKAKVAATILGFSILGYILGCLVHSEFWHHIANWLFGG